MKESYLYKKLRDKKVQCDTCARKCLISTGERGICGARINMNGKLFVLNYEKAISESIDPIEKKPLFHFYSGTHSLSIATAGCNLRCGNCQNWQISQLGKTNDRLLEMGQNLPPEKVVEDAIKNKCPSISYTYTEPTVFLEYAFDIMKLAHKKEIKNVWVTNGFMSSETLNLIAPYLDAANVDLKSFSDEFYTMYCGGKIKPVLENLKSIKKLGIWLEVTTLVIPKLNDSDKNFADIANFINNKLGSETPWHISSFSGEISWKMKDVPDTPCETISRACEIGKRAGLKYVYSGNIIGDPRENTYCPKCGKLVIKRVGFIIERLDKDGKCGECGEDINII